MLLIIVINKIQESCIHSFLINLSAIIWYLTRKLFILKSIWFGILLYWSMAYRSNPLEKEDKINITLVIN